MEIALALIAGLGLGAILKEVAVFALKRWDHSLTESSQAKAWKDLSQSQRRTALRAVTEREIVTAFARSYQRAWQTPLPQASESAAGFLAVIKTQARADERIRADIDAMARHMIDLWEIDSLDLDSLVAHNEGLAAIARRLVQTMDDLGWEETQARPQ